MPGNTDGELTGRTSTRGSLTGRRKRHRGAPEISRRGDFPWPRMDGAIKIPVKGDTPSPYFSSLPSTWSRLNESMPQSKWLSDRDPLRCYISCFGSGWPCSRKSHLCCCPIATAIIVTRVSVGARIWPSIQRVKSSCRAPAVSVARRACC